VIRVLMNPGKLGNTVGASVGRWFFDRDAVVRQVDAKERKRLSMAGAFVRRTMKTLLRKKQKRKTLADLTEDEGDTYGRMVRYNASHGLPEPKIPFFHHSKPGEPPRQGRNPLVRDHVYFAYDPNTRSVVTGPATLNGTAGNVPQVLDQGGQVESYRLKRMVTIEPRPFREPSLQANVDKFPELFRNLWT
jgi:hypothetical protein